MLLFIVDRIFCLWSLLSMCVPLGELSPDNGSEDYEIVGIQYIVSLLL